MVSLVPTLIAAMALQLPQGALQLQCGLTNSAAPAAGETTQLTIRLDVGGSNIESAEIDGPPLFSSSQGIVMFDATPRRAGGFNTTRREPSRRELRWTPRLDGATIALTRQNSRITLAPDAAVAGTWRGTYDLGRIAIGHNWADGPAGDISCHRTAQ
jgi:hypothetical protein